MKQLMLSVLPQRFAICRLDPDDVIPDWLSGHSFWSLTRTDEELSLVLPEEAAPYSRKAEKGWRCFKVHGPLDFCLTGVLASLTSPLAKADISIFAISTYDSDYILVREWDLDKAKGVLLDRGHTIQGVAS